jgi:hypothetical protein
MIIELFMYGFFTCLISYVVCMALGLIVGVIIFGSSVTMLQAFVLTPLIGFALSIFFYFNWLYC